MTENRVSVLIVGGGSVGLATALFLADRGVQTLVVEAQDGPSLHPRATGLGRRTMEMFRALGLQEAINEVCVDMVAGLGKVYARSLAETDFAAMQPDQAMKRTWDAVETSPGIIRGTCPQHRLDSVVLPAARERGAVVRYSARVDSVSQDDDGVRAVLESGEVLHADYLIAADGVRSQVRESLEIGVTGPGPLGKPMMSMLFRADLTSYLQGRSFVTCNIENPGVTGMLVTVDGAKEWILHTACGDADEFTDEHCRELILAAIGDDTVEVEMVSALPWRPRGLVADRFRVGRVFLVGDAVHGVPPLGAFGLNTGVADGHNLAWKLAAVIHGHAGDGLLDTYEAERRPVALMTTDQAMRRLADAKLHWDSSPETVAARIAGGVLNAPVVHLGYRYDSTAVIDPHVELVSTEDVSLLLDGSPGSRLPHLWIEHDGSRVSTLDLVGPGCTLLTASEQWERTGREVAALYPGMTVHRITVGDTAWTRSVGINADGAVLVRPDQFVAWRISEFPDNPGKELASVLDRVLSRGDL
ncbi:FAD-dependent oxidoreductase [Nocardia sp. NPDC051030]|uniref:FAD-dependent oxidoreductase n=1 Tax=Nocardia sp. NPDC051030 TaxID=3155162 RepID=UPI0034260A8E